MGRYRTPLIIGLAAVALLLTVGTAGALLTRNAFADTPWRGGPWHDRQGFALPPELESLRDLPSGQRFDRFTGAQLTVTDRDNNPLTVTLIPGRATAISATSLTLAANDGSTRTVALADATLIGGKRLGDSDTPSIDQNESVVVVTINDGATASAVLTDDWRGFGRRWRGPFGQGR